jgi:hypothetical protein
LFVKPFWCKNGDDMFDLEWVFSSCLFIIDASMNV